MMGRGLCFVLMVLNFFLASSLTVKIQVCQNKDCCRNFGSKTSSSFYNLPQVIHDLTSEVEVESTGCLSKCDKGPNMQIGRSPEILHRVKDHIQAAAALDSLGIVIPVQNMAAIAVLENASQGTL
jgi:NADH:ubiquinone oxidoreductase subunit E